MGKSQSKGKFAFCGTDDSKKEKSKFKEIESINVANKKFSSVDKQDAENYDSMIPYGMLKKISSQKNTNFNRDSTSSKEIIGLKTCDTFTRNSNGERNSSDSVKYFTEKYLTRTSGSVRRLSSFNPTSNKKLDLANLQKLKVIGRGTFGKVLLVKSDDDNKLYALKCIKKIHVLKTNNLSNILNEKKIFEKLDSPFIIKLIQTFQDQEMLYLLFDYYNGGELFFHIQKMKRFNEEIVKFYAAEIYCALEYLHTQKIIYRDLKPENIVLDKFGHIKLIDFGLAKDFNKKRVDLCSTFCGTNEYIPPEVISGERYSYNFDWWGYGNIIYEMLYGRPPFTDSTGSKNTLFQKIVKEEPNFTKYTISHEAKDLIKSLLKKNPNDRINPARIPKHPFFKNIDFNMIRAKLITPQLRPEIKNEYDFTNIDSTFLKENVNSPVKKLKYEIDQSKFADF